VLIRSSAAAISVLAPYRSESETLKEPCIEYDSVSLVLKSQPYVSLH